MPYVVDSTAATRVREIPSPVMPVAEPRSRPRISLRELLLLAALTLLAIVVHGYHGFVEDAEIYLPGVLKHLDPALFPRNTAFFDSHAGMTLFPALMAGSIRLSHLGTGGMLLFWHVATVFGLLLACFRVARLCFAEKHAVWCGVVLVASLLTLPVAGTALYIMDQYVTSRSFSTPASMMALASLLERRYLQGAFWVAFSMAVHPLMALFLIVLASTVWLFDSGIAPRPLTFWLFPLSLFPPMSAAYRQVLLSRAYFFLTNWSWYEWVGIFAPCAIVIWMAIAVRRFRLGPLAPLLAAVAVFEAVCFGAALVISVPGPLERFAEIQPMRCLLLVYILMFLAGGCLLGKWILRRRMWRWALLFAPLCAGMAMAQVDLFPDSRHLELPWARPGNAWVEGFDWIRNHTPVDAYFALDPDYERLPGEDVHGFRAIARRSMLADNGKDSGAVSMFPALAGQWKEQVDARRGWRNFARPDFEKLKARYGVDWVVLEQPGVRGLDCPYGNGRILVCRVE